MVTKAWDWGSDESPSDYLIGHLTNQYEGDEQSLQFATMAVMAATFMRGGLTYEEAVAAVERQIEGGAAVNIALRPTDDGYTLSLNFDRGET